MSVRSYHEQDELTVALPMTATESWPILRGPSEVEDLILVFMIVLTLDVGRIDWEDDFLLFCFDSCFGSGCNTRGGGLCFVDPSPPAAVRSPGGRAFCGDLITTGFAEAACCLICFNTWGVTNTVCFFFGDLTTTGGAIRVTCCCLGDLTVWRRAVDDCWLILVALAALKAGLMETFLVHTGGVPGVFAGTIITSESFKTLAAGALGWSELLVFPTLIGGCCFVGVGSLTVVARGSLVSFSFSWCSSLPCFGVAMLVVSLCTCRKGLNY